MYLGETGLVPVSFFVVHQQESTVIQGIIDRRKSAYRR